MDTDGPPESLPSRIRRWLSSAGVFFLAGNGPDDERPSENDIVAAPPGGQNQEEALDVGNGNGRSPSPPPPHFQPLNWMYWSHWNPALYTQEHFYYYLSTYGFPYPYGDPFAFYTYPQPIYQPSPPDFDHLFPDAFHHPAVNPAPHPVDPQDDQQAVMELLQMIEIARQEVEVEDNHLEMDENRQNSSCVIYVENIGPLEHPSDSSLSEDTVSPSTSGLSSSRRCNNYDNDNGNDNDNELDSPKRPRCSDNSDSD